MQSNIITARSSSAVSSANKLIRNTYMLLSMTLLFSALTAALSVYLHMPPLTYLLSLGGAMLLIWGENALSRLPVLRRLAITFLLRLGK